MLRGRGQLRLSLSKSYPYLLWAEQTLAEVRNSGLPDPHYNDTLEEFDQSLIAEVEKEEKGLTALVETFAGKRTYYFYVKDVAIEQMRSVIEGRYPKIVVKWGSREDPSWDFLKNYARDFNLPSFLDPEPS